MLLLSFNLSAQLSSYYTHLTVSSFNDSWGGAFTPSRDDQRSFGAIIDYQFVAFKKVAQAKITYSALTNRYANPDSGRIDELDIYLRFPVWIFQDKIELSATGGAIITGNLGGQSIQNRIHQDVGVGNLDLSYPANTKAFGFFGGQLLLHKMFFISEYNSYFDIESILDYHYAPNYNQVFQIKIGPSIGNTANNKIALHFGYANNKTIYTNTALKSVANTETGFFINYGMRLGIANFGFTIYPETQFTSGYLGLTLLSGGLEKPLNKIDVTTEIGALSADNGLYVRYLWNKAGADKNNWLIDFHYQFWTLGKKQIENYPNTLGNYQQFSLGVNYHFIKPKNTWQILPYLSARAGINQDKTFGSNKEDAINKSYSFMLISEAGLRLKMPTNIAKKNCYYGFTPSYTMANAFGEETNTQFYFGFAGFVMVDF